MTSTERIQIIVADDYPGMVELVRGLLETRWEVVATVSDGQALLQAAEKLKPAVLVVDIHMPVLNGIEIVKRLKMSGGKEKVIFLTVDLDPDFVAAALAMGVDGFVVKRDLHSCLITAIETAFAGRKFVCSSEGTCTGTTPGGFQLV